MSLPNTHNRWSIQRLDKLQSHYENLLQKAFSNPEDRKRLIAITRRARKRLSKLGIAVRDQPDGKAQFYQRRPNHLTSNDPDVIQAGRIVSYIKQHDLGYGTAMGVVPSWAITLNTYRLPGVIADYLSHVMPDLISEYATLCADLIDRALDRLTTPMVDVLLFGVPPRVRQLWREFATQHSHLPYCFRPDLILETSGTIRAIEFNVDSRLDRGIAHGVTAYSADLIELQTEQFLADDLARAYAKAARKLAGASTPVVATLYNPGCRAEYARQEEFFSRTIAESEGVPWRVLPMHRVAIDRSSGFIVERDTGRRLDVVVLELELLDDTGKPRLDECEFLESILTNCAGTRILGTILPYADKMLMALVTSDLTIGQQLRSALVPTSILSEAEQNGNSASVDELKRCPTHQQHFVLKRTGIHLDSTGSKSVMICSDVGPDRWARALDQAMSDLEAGHRGWIVQPRSEPAEYRVRYKLKPQGRTREDASFVRLSAFYVSDGNILDRGFIAKPTYSLAGAVATAGTDQETLRRRLYTVRALRQSTYMAVTRLVPNVESAGLEFLAGDILPGVAALTDKL